MLDPIKPNYRVQVKTPQGIRHIVTDTKNIAEIYAQLYLNNIYNFVLQEVINVKNIIPHYAKFAKRSSSNC